jgi:hypothetical protein
MAEEERQTFDTSLLDRAIARNREQREAHRLQMQQAAFDALEALGGRCTFSGAYLFGSIVRPYRFGTHSDVDIAVEGLRDEDYFPAAAFLSQTLGRDVDLVQLESFRFADRVLREGIPWKRTG